MRKLRWFTAVLTVLALVTSVLPAQAADLEVRELTLEECLELAQKNSPRLRLAAVALDQAKLGLKEAKSQKKKLDEAEEALDQLKSLPELPPDIDLAEMERSLATATSSVDSAFLKDNGVWMAEQQLTLAQVSYDLAGEGVRLAILKAYYDLLKAEADLALAQEAEKEAAEFQRVTAAQAKVGMATPAQELAAESALAQARAGRLGAENVREANRLALLKEIGLDLATSVRLAPAPITPEEFDLDQTVQAALERSIEIKAAAFKEELAARKFDLTKRWYPEITYQYKGAEYEALTAELELLDTKIKVETGVRSSYNLLLAAQEQLSPAERAVAQAEENLRVVQAKLKVGTATELEVLQAKRAVAQAKSSQIATYQNYALAAASLKAAALGLTGVGSGSASADAAGSGSTGGAGF